MPEIRFSVSDCIDIALCQQKINDLQQAVQVILSKYDIDGWRIIKDGSGHFIGATPPQIAPPTPPNNGTEGEVIQ